GGGIRPGQVLGGAATIDDGHTAAVGRAHDFLATIYHHLGIDASAVTIQDFTGRPTLLVENGTPIPELLG
ncbi:MAG: DUF1501 domain-containing protein, partial [Planctomycetaceae bacterium]